MRTATLLVYDSPAQAAAGPAIGLPAFDFILDRAAAIRQIHSDAVSWLCARFGLRREPDWPVAPLLARAAGLPSVYPAWLCADPVHIELGSHRTTMLPPAALALDETECAELAGALDSHFSARGLRLFVFDRDRWLINTALPVGIGSRPLDAVPGEVDTILASGPDAARWNAFLTEAQMLLHAHPLNAARQDAGRPPVSSLYLWGGGSASRAVCRDAVIASDDPLTLALGAGANAPVATTAAEVIGRMEPGVDFSALVVRRLGATSSTAWNSLRTIDREWLAPLLNALRARRIDSLELVMPQARGLAGHRVTRLAFWKLWKGLRWIAAYSAGAQGK